MIIKTDPREDAVSRKAMKDMETAFKDTFKRLKQTSPGDISSWNSLESKLDLIIHRVYLDSYYSACKEVEAYANKTTVLHFRRLAQARAKQVSGWMRDWTLKSLGIHAASKKSRLLGAERAEDAASHEVFTAYYVAKLKGWSEDKAAKKESVLSGDHDNDDICDDCADQGPIDIDEEFDSGEQAPPHHFACECLLFLRR